MVKLSRAQREAVFNVYLRTHPEVVTPLRDAYGKRPMGFYKAFRRQVQPMFCGNGAVVLPWCGMWLAIETDGYTHS